MQDQPNPTIGTTCVGCGQVVLTTENLSVYDPTTGAGVCDVCVPKGGASVPPGMLDGA